MDGVSDAEVWKKTVAEIKKASDYGDTKHVRLAIDCGPVIQTCCPVRQALLEGVVWNPVGVGLRGELGKTTMRKGDIGPGGDQAHRVMPQALASGAEQPVEVADLGEAADMGYDPAEPCPGGRDVPDRECHQHLMIFIETSQDIALDIIYRQ